MVCYFPPNPQLQRCSPRSGYNADLLPTLQKYIALRRYMARQGNSTEENEPIREAAAAALPATQDSAVTNMAGSSTPSRNAHLTLAIPNGARSASPTKLPITPILQSKLTPAASIATPRTPTPMSAPPERLKPPQTTREMLSHMAWLSEEVLKASEEKVNLAQAAFDSVGGSSLLASQRELTICRLIVIYA
jgi:hypothetical protein